MCSVQSDPPIATERLERSEWQEKGSGIENRQAQKRAVHKTKWVEIENEQVLQKHKLWKPEQFKLETRDPLE